MEINQTNPVSPIAGKIKFEINIFIQGALQQTEVMVYDIVLDSVTDPEQILNGDDFDYNDFERSIRLDGLLKKTSFLQSVSIFVYCHRCKYILNLEEEMRYYLLMREIKGLILSFTDLIYTNDSIRKYIRIHCSNNRFPTRN